MQCSGRGTTNAPYHLMITMSAINDPGCQCSSGRYRGSPVWGDFAREFLLPHSGGCLINWLIVRPISPWPCIRAHQGTYHRLVHNRGTRMCHIMRSRAASVGLQAFVVICTVAGSMVWQDQRGQAAGGLALD